MITLACYTDTDADTGMRWLASIPASPPAEPDAPDAPDLPGKAPDRPLNHDLPPEEEVPPEIDDPPPDVIPEPIREPPVMPPPTAVTEIRTMLAPLQTAGIAKSMQDFSYSQFGNVLQHPLTADRSMESSAEGAMTAKFF